MNDELKMLNAESDTQGNSSFSTHNSSFHVPEIRFKGFSEEWANINIGDIFQVTSGATPLRSDARFF